MDLVGLLKDCKEMIRQRKLRYELNVIDVVKTRAMRLTDIMLKKEMYPNAYIRTNVFDSIYVNTKEFRIGFTEDKAYDGDKLESYIEKEGLEELLENVDFIWIRRPYHHNFHRWKLEPESHNKLKKVFNQVREHYGSERDKILEVEKLLKLRENLINESSMGSRSLKVLKHNEHFDLSLIAYENYTFIVTKNDDSGEPKGRDFIDRGGENMFVGDYMNMGIVLNNAVLGTKEEFEKIIEKCQELEKKDKMFGKICFPEGRGKKKFSLEIKKGYKNTKTVAVRYISIIDKENIRTALGLYRNIDF